MTIDLRQELSSALECLEQALKQYESLQAVWQVKEANYVKTQVELISNNDALKAQSVELSQRLQHVQNEFKSFKDKHEGCEDKITAYRSVARALESENQLLSGEKYHLEQFKIQYCNKNGALKVAVDQVDSLRRQILFKEDEVKKLQKHNQHEEIEKIKIVQKLAQVEYEFDQKNHQVRHLQSQLSDKEDTLEALRVAKRDVELRLQKQMTENAQFQGTHSKLKQTENHVEALESELVMQESIYESRIKEMQRDLDKQIDEIYQNKEKEVENVQSRYANLFHEKAEELLALRNDYENSVKKIEQQSRTISDLEYKEKELSTLLSKKQACHHREYDKTFQELQKEMKNLQDITAASELELKTLRLQFQSLSKTSSSNMNNGKLENPEEIIAKADQVRHETEVDDVGNDLSKSFKKKK